MVSQVHRWVVGSSVGIALLGSGCAQLKQNLLEPKPHEHNFEHVLLGDRNPYYPKLAPRPVPPPNGERATTAERRTLVVASTVPEEKQREGRAVRVPRTAEIRAAAGFGPDGAPSDDVESEAVAKGEAPAETPEGFAFPGTEPEAEPVAQQQPSGSSFEKGLPPRTSDESRDDTAVESNGAATVPLDAQPERPRAPKATADMGLGDPQGTTEGAVAVPPDAVLPATDDPAGLGDESAVLPDFDPAVAPVDFADPTDRPAEAPVPDSSRASTVPKASTARSPVRSAAPRSAVPAAIASGADPRDVLGDGTIRGEVLAAAQRLIGVKTPFDEARFLAHLLSAADVDIAEGTESELYIKSVYESLDGGGRTFGAGTTPEAGDLVFFSNTFDRDADGRSDDWFTMAGVVESVQGNGTVIFIGVFGGEVRRMILAPGQPSVGQVAGGALMNSELREKSLSDRPFTKYLSGELFAAFGRLQED